MDDTFTVYTQTVIYFKELSSSSYDLCIKMAKRLVVTTKNNNGDRNSPLYNSDQTILTQVILNKSRFQKHSVEAYSFKIAGTGFCLSK